MTFMVQYKDGYSRQQAIEIIAENKDAAWDLAEKMLGSEVRIYQIYEIK